MNWAKTRTPLVIGGVPRVNLMPPEELEERRRWALRMRWLRVFIVTTVLVGSLVVLAFGWQVQASASLANQEHKAVELRTELGRYTQVAEAIDTVEELEAMRATAGSNDLAWGALIAEIKSALPAGVALSGFEVAPGAAPKSGASASAQIGLTGTLTFSSRSTATQAQTVSNLRLVKGFIGVDAGGLESDGSTGGYTFEVTFSADQSRYTGRFSQNGSK